MFGRAAIRLVIGPHSSFVIFCRKPRGRIFTALDVPVRLADVIFSKRLRPVDSVGEGEGGSEYAIFP